ncbi:hypothetical protein AVEN_83503-1 [Araneus ventricosus]|uniref:Uncharacterized protein n=1 Tax=Araneus ventricosus TaxID=182803 RepID=A0A4Y2U382_ARAVE|nr:hypothetical protein AVEN_83503-1 [Araneus ventricosus]
MYPVSRKSRPHIQSGSQNTRPHIQSGSCVEQQVTTPYGKFPVASSKDRELRPNSSKYPWHIEAWCTLAFFLEYSMYPVSRNTRPHIQRASRVGLKATTPYGKFPVTRSKDRVFETQLHQSSVAYIGLMLVSLLSGMVYVPSFTEYPS